MHRGEGERLCVVGGTCLGEKNISAVCVDWVEWFESAM